ncbi:MAG: hypothetical protein ACE5QW_00455 [Thermoplasmata archaeon]
MRIRGSARLEREEFPSDVGFTLVISCLIAATFGFQYVDSNRDSALYELNEDECDSHSHMFSTGSWSVPSGLPW